MEGDREDQAETFWNGSLVEQPLTAPSSPPQVPSIYVSLSSLSDEDFQSSASRRISPDLRKRVWPHKTVSEHCDPEVGKELLGDDWAQLVHSAPADLTSPLSQANTSTSSKMTGQVSDGPTIWLH